MRGTKGKEKAAGLGKQVFTSMDAAEEFVDLHFPGREKTNRLLNYVDLTGLAKTGYYIKPEDEMPQNIGEYGYVAPCTDPIYEACNLWYTEDDADIFPYSNDLLQPVLCWE